VNQIASELETHRVSETLAVYHRRKKLSKEVPMLKKGETSFSQIGRRSNISEKI
jgi:hypothetical protein